MDEGLGDVPAEEEAGAARGEAPALDVVWVGPEEVAHGPVVRDFLFAVDCADLVRSSWSLSFVVLIV